MRDLTWGGGGVRDDQCPARPTSLVECVLTVVRPASRGVRTPPSSQAVCPLVGLRLSSWRALRRPPSPATCAVAVFWPSSRGVRTPPPSSWHALRLPSSPAICTLAVFRPSSRRVLQPSSFKFLFTWLASHFWCDSKLVPAIRPSRRKS